MNEMVERVARALHVERHRVWNELGGPHPEVFTWEMDNEPFREQLRVEARAFIASMRDPTSAMLWAVHAGDSPAETWQAMIDEALK